MEFSTQNTVPRPLNVIVKNNTSIKVTTSAYLRNKCMKTAVFFGKIVNKLLTSSNSTALKYSTELEFDRNLQSFQRC